MPTGPNGEKRPRDMNQLAHKIIQIATGRAEEARPERRQPNPQPDELEQMLPTRENPLVMPPESDPPPPPRPQEPDENKVEVAD